MRIDPPIARDPALASVLAALGSARLVGGAVRDALLGRPLSDIDLATPLEPSEVMARLAEAGIRTVPTGLAHGTVTAIVSGRGFEITTLRRDVETDGRHAVVAFTDDWAVDARRRDLTINAIYADADGALFDPVGGIADLRAGRVRFIGEPAARIAEDHLRILRFFRFTAWFGSGPVDRPGYAACVAGQAGLDDLAAERVRTELLKLLSAPDPMTALKAMAAGGILRRILGAGAGLDALAPLVLAEHIVGDGSALRRLGALGVAPDDLALRLRLSKSERARLVETAAVPRLGDADPARLRALAYRHGAPHLINRLFLDRPPGWRDGLKILGAWAPPSLPVTGRDAIARGLAGRAVGEALVLAEEAWIASDFTLDRDALLAQLDAIALTPPS